MNGNEKTLLPPCSTEVDRTTWPLPPLVAHRGAGFLAPENTLKAFATAATVGCLAVEFDVRLTIDGELVLSHDTELGRVIGGCGCIEELTAEELRKLKVRNLHRPDQSVVNVCFLSEAMQACNSLGLSMNVELKPVSGQEAALAERVASFLRAKELAVPLLVSSFSAECLFEFRKRCPETCCGFLFEEPIGDWSETARRLQVQTVHPHKDLVTPELIETAHAHGWGVMAWTVDDVRESAVLKQIGTDAICTNRPDLLKEIF